MKKENRQGGPERFFSVLTLILGIILTAGVMLVFHACGPKDDGGWMSCHYAQLTVFGLGIAMACMSVFSLFADGKLSAVLRILTIVCAAAAAVIPGNVIHLCMMSGMRCRAVMRPSVILLSVLIMASCCGGLLTGRGRCASS